MISGLYGITSPKLSGDNLLSHVEQALTGGCRFIQYRNKEANHSFQKKEASSLLQLCHQYKAKLIINDDIDLTLAIDADGLHLGQGDGSIAKARKLLGPKKILGITCHDNIELAQKSEEQGADYVAFGRFFPSRTKPEAPSAKLSILTEAKKKITLPIVAIGGISVENANTLITQGADAIAVIHGLFASATITETARELSAFFDGISQQTAENKTLKNKKHLT